MQRFKVNGSVEDRRVYQNAWPVRTCENIADVRKSIREESSTCTRHRLEELNISCSGSAQLT